MDVYINQTLFEADNPCGCGGCQCGADQEIESGKQEVKSDDAIRIDEIAARFHHGERLKDADVDFMLSTLRLLMCREADAIRELASAADACYSQTDYVDFARGMGFALDLLERKFGADVD